MDCSKIKKHLRLFAPDNDGEENYWIKVIKMTVTSLLIRQYVNSEMSRTFYSAGNWTHYAQNLRVYINSLNRRSKRVLKCMYAPDIVGSIASEDEMFKVFILK